MGKYDDLREMGRLSGELDDDLSGAPSAEDIASSTTEEIPSFSAESDDDTLGNVISLDQLLGLGDEPEATREPEPKGEDGEEEEPKGRRDRISELSEQLNAERRRNDELVNRLLDRRPDNTESDDGVQPEELSPATKEYFKKYGLVTKEEVSGLLNDLEPVMKRVKDERIAAAIAAHVDGFTVQNMPALYKAMADAPEQKRALYEEGLAGAVILARDLVGGGSPDTAGKRRTGSSLASRHHSEAGSSSRRDNEVDGEAEKLRRIESLTAEQIHALLDGIG
jgi:hypothetical protein